ncbi:uncharacterized protein [Acropora muricata]|uniref:uncharacterized protein isoform X2 n=1 Tax=Acropora muricata TaxID=159855 RepID=UPI0034E3D1B0
MAHLANQKKMWILSSLSHETFESLANALEKYSTIGWKKLMTEGFNHIYSQNDVEEIEQKRSPATALLIDLDGRGESLENLIGALEKIGNKRAIAIIKKGRSPTSNTDQMRDGRIYQDFDGCPSHRSIREAVEHAMNDDGEQAGTLIQESRGNGRHPDELGSSELLINFFLWCFCQ